MKGDTMPEFSTMLDLQAQMMLLLAIGVFLAKKKLITDQGRACLTDLLLFIILPANIIQSFRIEFNAEIFRSTRDILILSILLQVLYSVVCAVCYNRYPFARKAVMQYGTVCSNAGFLGSPLAEGLFGGVGLLLASFYMIPQRIVMWSVGVSYFMQDAAPATPEEKKKHRLAVLRKTITHPCIASVFVGMVIMLTQWQLPTFLGKAVQCTSSCNMTMSMFLIGAIIGSRDLHPLLDKDAILYCIIRLFLMPLVVLVGVSYFMQDAAPATPEEKKKHRLAVLRKTITHPCIASVFVGMVIMLTQWQLPTFLGKAVQCTSSCNMTMSMFLIGAIIGSRDLHPLLDKDAILYCIIRLFLMPLVVLVGCRAAHVGQLATGVAVVLAGMPMGGTTTILAEKYGADSAFASKCTAISTVLSLITTPLWCLAV